MEFSVSTDIGGRPLMIQVGKIAKQASGSVLVQYGETIVMVTVVSDTNEKIFDFLPLSVEYQEKIYAAGRIPSNYFRREMGRPSEKEILTSRLIDRPIRPLFHKNYKNETQVICTVLSMDYENDPDILAMLGASVALTISDIPFNGPIAPVRIGRINGKLVVNPTISQIALSDMNIITVGSKNEIVMVEGNSSIVKERDIVEAIFYAHELMQPLIDVQNELYEKVGKSKKIISKVSFDDELINIVNDISFDNISRAINISSKVERKEALLKIKENVYKNLDTKWHEHSNVIDNVLSDIQKKMCRELVLKKGKRIDNREFDQIRPITCEIGILPRPHGSSLFTRGETQSLAILTLGSGQDEQRVGTLTGEEYKSFMLHYNFPPFSVGEVRRITAPSRRDIGHGALATRALEKVIPSKDLFDYTIRIVSEILESNGSSSMATVCAATLALMDGGVPIKAPVSGIAMGLMKDNDNIIVLTDILGDEDHAGDMDFKVAGTSEGVTALQMDVKISGLSRDILEEALEKAKIGRLKILDIMLKTINTPRKNISVYAPRIITIVIPQDKIRDVIGQGGKVIRALQSSTNTKIEIDDSGLVKIIANSFDEVNVAKAEIEKLTAKPKVGKIYTGKVVKITEFGAFVQIMPGVDGLLHISQIANHHVSKVTDIINEGEEVRVKVLEISKDGKIRLSRKVIIN